MILGLGVLGVVGLFLAGGLEMLKHDVVQAILTIGAFVVAAAMGAMAQKQPQKWQPIVALVAFLLASFKMRVWEMLPHIVDLLKAGRLGIGLAIAMIAGIAGAVFSILALLGKGNNQAA